MLEFSILFFSWLVGGFVNTVSGMGAAVIAFPVISLILPFEVLVPVSCIASAVVTFYLTCQYFKFIDYKFLIPMLFGSIPGTLAGIYILVWISKSYLQILLGVLLLVYAIWQYTLKEVKLHPANSSTCFTIGVISAITNASTSIGGPPLYAYSVYAGWERKMAIATLSAYHLLITTIIAIPGQYVMGLFAENVAYYTAVSVFGLVIGICFGTPYAKKISAKNYRALLIGVIFLAGILCVFKGFYS